MAGVDRRLAAPATYVIITATHMWWLVDLSRPWHRGPSMRWHPVMSDIRSAIDTGLIIKIRWRHPSICHHVRRLPAIAHWRPCALSAVPVALRRSPPFLALNWGSIPAIALFVRPTMYIIRVCLGECGLRRISHSTDVTK